MTKLKQKTENTASASGKSRPAQQSNAAIRQLSGLPRINEVLSVREQKLLRKAAEYARFVNAKIEKND